MANTYTLITSSIVGGGGLANINFTSIPNTYTDLALSLSLRGSSTAGGDKWVDVSIGFNGAGSNVSITDLILYGLGNTTGATNSITPSGGAMPTSDATASTFSSCLIYIPNYLSSTTKTYSMDNVTENDATRAVISFTGGFWANSAAINAITLYPGAGNFVQYSTFYLYGIKKS